VGCIACTAACSNGKEAAYCGDGNTDLGYEECDDGNTEDGDGCSSSCEVEFACQAGEELVSLNGDAGTLPDGDSQYYSLPATALQGAVRKIQIGVNLTHEDISQLGVSFVIEQDGAIRSLFDGVTDNEEGSHLFVFDDSCVEPLGLGDIAAAGEGANGCYIPLETLAGAQGAAASGTHQLYISDNSADGKSGTLAGFWMYLCVQPSVCGNGIVEDGEQCDEASASCNLTNCTFNN
jgi:cysteine-rich repeat protein